MSFLVPTVISIIHSVRTLDLEKLDNFTYNFLMLNLLFVTKEAAKRSMLFPKRLTNKKSNVIGIEIKEKIQILLEVNFLQTYFFISVFCVAF